MSEQGSAAEKGPAAGQGGVSVEECEDMIQKSLKTPTVKFLRERMAKAGCSVGQDLIRAVTCDKHITGGYVPGEGVMHAVDPECGHECHVLEMHKLWSIKAEFARCVDKDLRLVEHSLLFGSLCSPCRDKIIVCSNHMRSQDDVNQVVKHKLINAYDDCRAANLNWANCAHHACSEIRANHLSGDCHYKRELLRGNMKIRGREQECVRRRALKAVAANPHCSKVAASDAMDAIWDICYNDTQPFDRAP